MSKDEALKLALEALEEAADAIDSWGSYASGYFQVKHDLENDISKAKNAITAIKEALAQPEQPKVRTGNCLRVGVCASEGHKIQPQHKPLTDEEIEDIWADCPADWDDKINVLTLARAIEAAHGIKGEA